MKKNENGQQSRPGWLLGYYLGSARPRPGQDKTRQDKTMDARSRAAMASETRRGKHKGFGVRLSFSTCGAPRPGMTFLVVLVMGTAAASHSGRDRRASLSRGNLLARGL
ncbi:hypothetical protein MY3296_000266 [Beauveria thailandica]